MPCTFSLGWYRSKQAGFVHNRLHRLGLNWRQLASVCVRMCVCGFGPDLSVHSRVLGFPHRIHIRPRKVPFRAQATRGPVGLEVWQSPEYPQAFECLDWLKDVQVVCKRKMEYVSLSGWERGSDSLPLLSVITFADDPSNNDVRLWKLALEEKTV